MARFRYTNNELIIPESDSHMSDYDLIKALINERLGDTTNHYSPLSLRLKQLRQRVERAIDQTEDFKNGKYDSKQ